MVQSRARRLTIGGLVLLIAVAAVAGCGGENGGGVDETATVPTGAETATPAGTETVSPELAALRALWERTVGSPHTAWYDVAIDSSEPRTTLSGSLRAVLDGERLALEFEGQNGAGQLLDFLYIETPVSRYVCNVVDTRSQCVALDEPTGALGDALAQLRLPAWVERVIGAGASVTVEQAEGATIGGIASECFAFVGAEQEGTLCLGIDLPAVTRLEGTISGTEVRIELTQYSPEASADAFEPPYPVSGGGN